MIRVLLVMSCLIGSVEVAIGQTSARISRPALVRAWHRQYFHREPEARAVASWSYLFRLGYREQEVLSAMLSTDEYYGLAGGTSEGFVLALFDDGAQGQFTKKGRKALLSRTRGLSRRSLATTFLQTYPEALRAGPSHAGVIATDFQKPVRVAAARSPPSPLRSRRPIADSPAIPRPSSPVRQ